MIKLDLNKMLNIYTLKCAETIELQRLIDVSKDGIFGSKTKKEVALKSGRTSVTLSDFKNMGYDVRNEIDKSEVWWLNTITDEKEFEKCKAVMEWWNNLASLRKTQLCDTNTEIVGHVRRHETLTRSEIEKIYNLNKNETN